jgi:hypothetical protein
MRQQQDPKYHQLLKWIRDATVDLLNARVVIQLESRPDRVRTCAVRTNRLRHAINRLQGQKIRYLARHTRRKKAKRARDMEVDNINC